MNVNLSIAQSPTLLQFVIERFRDWGILLPVSLLLFAACAPAYADPATVAASVDPQAIFAQLGEATTLENGSTQFASAINVDPKVVRIRIQPGNCTVCRFESIPQLSKAEGLTIEEATQLVEEKDQVSFFVTKFACTFLFEAGTFTPKSCQIPPI